MRTALRTSVLAAYVTSGCSACHRAIVPLAGEVRGLYTSGFETSLFRACDEPQGRGASIAFDSAAAQSRARWPAGAAVASGMGYHVHYVRWVVRDVPERPPAPPMIRISNAPKRAVVRVLEVRAPTPGQCGWQPGTLPDDAR